MNLVLVTALIAACGADKLDRTYLPPASATTAGGTPGSLQTPFKTFNQGLGGLPKGGYSNDFEGVVVDAAAPGTRASGADETGLGGPRIAYGSTDSKVGEAAFTADAAFPRVGVNSGLNTQGSFIAPTNFPQNLAPTPERIQSARDRVSNIVKYESDVTPEKFNYAFETDNGIVAEENGIELNGVKAQGGYSYTGDDGQVYSVTYTADEDGYRPQGEHLPTPPPIPAEILESLEKNAQDEAAGIVDDGSYDARKYNTGKDYTKSDNGQYTSGQSVQLGNRPQSDALASGSFINQNNQGLGFTKPNSQQFGSSALLDSSKNIPSNGNNFGTSSNALRPSQNVQTIGYGLPSNNEYLPPSNTFSQNRKPAPNGLQSNQFNGQSGFPTSLSTSNDDSRLNRNQNTRPTLFTPLAQQKLQEDGPKKPQSNSPVFGKPTVIDSSLSIKDPFAKRPSINRFSQNQQPNQKPQSTGGSFEVVSGNVYSSKNEYLPPRRQDNKPSQNNGQQRFPGFSSGTQSKQQFTTSPSASAFASVTRPSSGFQSSQQNNGQQTPQYTGNNLFSQLNKNPISRPTNQDQSTPSISYPNVPSLNKSPVSQYQSTFAPQPPTLKPQTGLTTQLEFNSDRNKGTAPIPITDGPDSPNFSSSPSSQMFGSQPSNTFLGQYNFNSNKIQQASPTQASISVVSPLSDQSLSLASQNTAKPGSPNLAPQSQLPEKSSVSGQYSFSTQKPSFNQYNQQQSSDDSYHYNTPSKPFNAPTPRPQASIFPSTSFDQSLKVTQTPFGSRPQSSETPSTSISSQSTRYPNPTLGPISPTSPTQQNEQSGNTFQTQFNKVTQASTSSFPSPIPTISGSFNGNQFDTKPSQSVDRQITISQGINQQNSPSKSQQQYGGEIYEYKKPPQTLPAPQSVAPTGQYGQTPQFGVSQSLNSQSQPTGAFKPGSQFGSFGQQSLDQRPLSSQISQENQAFNRNILSQTQQKPGRFSSQPTSQSSQQIQGASKFPPDYNNQAPSCCNQLTSPSQSSQGNVQGGTSPFKQPKPHQDLNQQGSIQGTKPLQSVSTFAGVGESFGGPRKPPSFDENGYHY